MLVFIEFFHSTLAKHFETSKIAVTASPEDSTEQMDPGPHCLQSQFPKLLLVQKKNLHFQYQWSEAWEIFSFEPLNSNGQCYFQVSSMLLEFMSKIVLRSEDEGSCEWTVVFSQEAAALACSKDSWDCELQITPRAGGKH